MLKGWLGRSWFGGAVRQFGPAQTDGLCYAVGDIHGRADLLVPLVDKILQDAVLDNDDEGVPPEIVFVGDFVDRGPDTRGVLEMLSAMTDWTEIRPIYLLGNHELMLLQFLNDPIAGRRWLRFGGYETLLSYEISAVGDIGDPDELHRLADALREGMGAHLPFIEDLLPMHASGNVLFTHAGADPHCGPDDQPIESLVWGTPEFARTARADGLWVVHGHTIFDAPQVRQGRIGIDTGAYRSGKLTAAKILRGEISFMTQSGPAAEDHYAD